MFPALLPITRRKRRGVILIMVIGVISLIFIIGASLMIVAQSERQAAHQQQAARQLRTIAESLENRALIQLREDLVGRDGLPYNSR